jgi:translation initiation factor 2 alpha subunit (eIF-2alpha)
MNLKEDDVVLCTVKSIEGTTVFVELESGQKGSISMSEIAAGRIRNIREYVAPNKKIVCKVLKIMGDNLQLSLRRVTSKEKTEVIESHEKEKNLLSMLKVVTKNPEQTIEKIKSSYDLRTFVDEARTDPKLLEKVMSKDDAEKFSKILVEKKEKEKEVKKTITIRSDSESGIEEIKFALDNDEVQIKYLGSSQFSVSASANEFKEANSKVQRVIDEIEKRAKEKKLFFELKEK